MQWNTLQLSNKKKQLIYTTQMSHTVQLHLYSNLEAKLQVQKSDQDCHSLEVRGKRRGDCKVVGGKLLG